MTPEQLMKQRYKVIAIFPNMAYLGDGFALGEIFDANIKYGFNEASLDAYPHLFKKLEWWEDRNQDELPEYVKWILGNKVTVIKIDRWTIKDDGEVYWWITDKDGNDRAIKIEGSDQPSTKEDYEKNK